MTTTSGTPSDAELVRFLQDFAGWELAGGDALRDSGNAAADKVCRENSDRINEAAARITALSAQVAELERDKARLDWLEADDYSSLKQKIDDAMGYWYSGAETYRAAIDAAMNRKTK